MEVMNVVQEKSVILRGDVIGKITILKQPE